MSRNPYEEDSLDYDLREKGELEAREDDTDDYGDDDEKGDDDE